MKLKLTFESLLKNEDFSKEFSAQLDEDVIYLEKLSTTHAYPALRTLKSMLPSLGVALGASALTGTISYLAAKKKYQDHSKNLEDSYFTLLGTHKDFSSNAQNFKQRFSELALISPTVASNPVLAQKIIKPRMDSGFDLDDVHRLAAIEHHTSSIPRMDSGPAAYAIAASALDRVANIMIPAYITQKVMAPIAKDIHSVSNKVSKGLTPEAEKSIVESSPDILQRAKKMMETGEYPDTLKGMKKHQGGGDMPKKGSDESVQRVSDECLGRMMAERYCMFKTAGLTGSITKFLKPGADQLVNYTKLMALPLAIGGGIQLVQSLMKQKDNAQVARQADQVFNGLRRNNSYVQENPQIAQEAFDTLKSFAPALAAKPLVAKTFVEHVITSDGRIPPDTAKMLADTQSLVNRLTEATGGGFIEGLKSPMSLFKHTVSAEDEHAKKNAELVKKYKKLHGDI